MKEIILVCNAHLDPVWLWRWQEGAGEALSTFRTAADFCEKFEGFVFNHNEALLYEWVEEYDPELFNRIQKLVDQGKWHIMGGWYLQPDCVMVSGESLIRQILYGRFYFQKKFHKVPTTAVNFDSFGHSVGLVQIMKKTGYDSYIVCRPGRAGELPGNDFEWVGLDGSRIIVHYSDENYNSVKGKAVEKLKFWMEKHREEELGLFLWGVGDHGGGPSRKDIISLREFFGRKTDCTFRESVPEEYFSKKDKEKLPEWNHSIGPVSEGCYTSQIRIKQKHRQLENAIYMAEKMMMQANWAGLCRYASEEFAEAQKALMKAQFHDALPGSTIREAEEDTLNWLGYGLELAERCKARAFFALCAGQPPVKTGTSPILVYNPHPFTVDTVIDCEVVLPEQNWENSYMVPTVWQGERRIPSQVEKESSSFEIDWRKRCVFRAQLEPMSMNRFDCRFMRCDQKPPVKLATSNGKICFEGERLKATVNCNTGLLDELLVDGVSYLKSGALKLAVMRDCYNSWGVGYQNFEDIEGYFTLMSAEEGSLYSGLKDLKTPSVRVIEDGEVRTVIESLFSYHRSALRMRLYFPKEGTEIGIEIQLQWQEKDKLLKLCVPTVLKNGIYLGQTAFGREKLFQDGSEVVSQKWSGLAEKGGRAVACIDDGLYGSNCYNGEIRITLVRSPGYGMSDCDGKIALKPGIMIDRMDQGERNFRLWIECGSEQEVMKGLENRALVHNEVPMSMAYCPPGKGMKPKPLLQIDSENIVLSAMKKAEKGNRFIIRLYECEGRKTVAKLKFPGIGEDYEIPFDPFEIKTFFFEQLAGKWREIPMLEIENFLL